MTFARILSRLPVIVARRPPGPGGHLEIVAWFRRFRESWLGRPGPRPENSVSANLGAGVEAVIEAATVAAASQLPSSRGVRALRGVVELGGAVEARVQDRTKPDENPSIVRVLKNP